MKRFTCKTYVVQQADREEKEHARTPALGGIVKSTCEMTTVARAKDIILATLVDRRNEGSWSARRPLSCRQRRGNPMKSRRASDSARQRPGTNLATAKNVSEAKKREKTTSDVRPKRPHFRGHSADTAFGRRQWSSMHVTEAVGPHLTPKSWQHAQPHCERRD
jgi:hypothetical protein